MSPLFVFAAALALTFLTRELLLRLLARRLRGTTLILTANAASLVAWTLASGLIKSSPLEAINTAAPLPYLIAQSIWLALDLVAARSLEAGKRR